jgi:LPXTG-motif cell wall-anchored protein
MCKTPLAEINKLLNSIPRTLNPNDTSGRPPPLNSTSAVQSSSSTSSLSTGAKTGIGIGAAIGGLLISLAVFLFYRHKRHPQRAAIPQLDSREKGGVYEVQGKDLQMHPIEMSAEEALGELDGTTERSTTVHELD